MYNKIFLKKTSYFSISRENKTKLSVYSKSGKADESKESTESTGKIKCYSGFAATGIGSVLGTSGISEKECDETVTQCLTYAAEVGE